MRYCAVCVIALAACEGGPTPEEPGDAGVVPAGAIQFSLAPPELTAERTARFEWDPPGDRFECALDADAPIACAPGVVFEALEDGAHRLGVRALRGEVRGPGAEHIWTVDGTAPVLTVDEAPPVSAETTAEIAFECDDANASFRCAHDGRASTVCTSPWRGSALVEGAHRLSVEAMDRAGNVARVEVRWRIDRTAPETRLVTAPPPLAGEGTARFGFESPDEDVAGFECSTDGASFAPCEAPLEVEVTAGEHRFRVRAVDLAGLSDPTPARHLWSVSMEAPLTRISSAPEARTAATTATFEFGPPGARFECALDAAPTTPCRSPLALADLAAGDHRLGVTAIDDLDRRDPTPAEHRWTVDLTAPSVEITAGPPPIDNRTRLEIAFAADDPGARTRCRADDGAWALCASPRALVDLAEGPHRFEVRARDDVGNVSQAAWAWRTDTRPPVTAITGRPPEVVFDGVRVGFQSEADARFECRLDGDAWAPCVSPHAVRAQPGPHALSIRATDPAGNIEIDPPRVVWRVDREPPSTIILAAPPETTRETEARFEFGPAGATFECRLDEGQWRACPPRWSVGGLADATHTLEVRATDEVGNIDDTPAEHRWTVDTRAPVARIVTGPPRYVPRARVEIEIETDEPAALRCATDDAAAVPCESPHVVRDLAEGEHRVEVVATDVAGNESAPVARLFTVDLRAPRTTIDEGPPADINQTRAAFRFGPPGVRFECRLDGGEWFVCGEAFELQDLEVGRHELWVRATDLAGNEDQTPASRVWTVDLAPPATRLEAAPPTRTRDDAADFEFSGIGGAVAFECALDGAPFAACQSPTRVADLSEGAHTFEVRAIDAAGNIEPQPRHRAWVVDQTPPPAVEGLVAWPGDRTVLLEWGSPADDVTGYRISRAAAVEGPFDVLHEGWRVPNEGDEGPNWFIDHDRPNDVSSFYRIEAIDGVAFEGPASEVAGATPTLSGRWVAVPDVPVRGWHAAALPTGKIIMWQSGETPHLFDPVAETFHGPIPAASNKFCSGMAMMDDGRILVLGGHETPFEQNGHRDWLGLPTSEIFDPWTETWTRIDDMPGGPRWYPSARTLPDGKVIVVGGIDARFPHPHRNPNIDLYDPVTNTFETVFDQNNFLQSTFPRHYLLEDGKLLFMGQATMYELDPETWTFGPPGSRMLAGRGGSGFAIELPDRRVMYLGGGGGHATAEVYDRDTKTWSMVASMGVERVYPNAMYLPDGRPLVTGGRNRVENVRRTQVYDFESDAWIDVGDHLYTHEYHSFLLPLPDGRAMAGGDQAEAELFYPWYLEAGPRPALIEAPQAVDYGERFEVRVASHLPPGPFTLVRIGGVTHAINSDQHFFTLEAEAGEDGRFTLTAPAQATVAPPGYYLLWAHDARGVPSEARYVRLVSGG